MKCWFSYNFVLFTSSIPQLGTTPAVSLRIDVFNICLNFSQCYCLKWDSFKTTEKTVMSYLLCNLFCFNWYFRVT